MASTSQYTLFGSPIPDELLSSTTANNNYNVYTDIYNDTQSDDSIIEKSIILNHTPTDENNSKHTQHNAFSIKLECDPFTASTTTAATTNTFYPITVDQPINYTSQTLPPHDVSNNTDNIKSIKKRTNHIVSSDSNTPYKNKQCSSKKMKPTPGNQLTSINSYHVQRLLNGINRAIESHNNNSSNNSTVTYNQSMTHSNVHNNNVVIDQPANNIQPGIQKYCNVLHDIQHTYTAQPQLYSSPEYRNFVTQQQQQQEYIYNNHNYNVQ